MMLMITAVTMMANLRRGAIAVFRPGSGLFVEKTKAAAVAK